MSRRPPGASRRTPLLVAAGLAALASPACAAPPQRVMSLNACADQLVLALLPPRRITSVTWLSRDAATSPMAAQARRVRINHGAAEEVVRDRPDLVVAGAYTTPATRALLARLRFTVLVMQPADSFADIRRDVRQVAGAVGEALRGEAIIARMDAVLARLARDPGARLRVAAWDGSGLSAQPGSLFDAVLAAAGARHVADEPGAAGAAGGQVEALLAAAPQLLVTGQPDLEPRDRRGDLARHPLVRRFWGDRTLILPQAAYVCGTPFAADAAASLRDRMRAKLAQASPPLALARDAGR